MAIEYINTLQGDILTSYNNAALANLGQRMGAKGDSIVVKSFTLNDIFDDISKTDKNYIVLQYYKPEGSEEYTLSVYNENTNNPIEFKGNNNAKTTITPIEYIGFSGTNNALNNCDVTKTQENSYFFKANINSNNIEYYIAIEILGENDINIAILYTTNNVKTLIVKDTDDYKKYIVGSLDNFNNINSFQDLINQLNSINSSNVSDFEETLCNTLISTLPKYIIELYNDNTYFYDNYSGLNKAIIENIVKQLFLDSFFNNIGTVNGIENNPFFIYLPKSLFISFYVNDNTGIYYDSLPINVKFIKDNGDGTPIPHSDNDKLFEDANINNYIIVDSDIEKAAAYKTYLEYDKLENISIRTDKLYSIPYIGSDNFWYINDIKTEVTATGKDAGNPNIIVLQTNFVDTQSADYDTSDINEVYFKQDGPNTLHTYAGIDIGKTNTNYTFEFVEEFYYKLNFNESNKTIPVSVGESKLNTYVFKVKLPRLNGANGLEHDINFDSIIKNSLVFYIIDNRLSYFYNDTDKQLTNANIDEFRETSLQHKLTNNNSEQSFITVLFHITTDSNGNYIWEPLTNEETGTVLDLGSMISSAEFAELFTRITVNPDKYKFSQLVLDNVNFLHKNNTNTSTNAAKIYPIIKNDNSEFYITNTVDNIDNTTTSDNTNTIAVHNNANITPKFVTISNIDNAGTDYLGKDFVINENPATKYINFNGDKFAESSFNTVENPKDLIPHEIWANNSGTGTYNTVSTIYPMFDFREVITTNQTAMNRLSLISLASSGVAYNAYIGNSANTNEEGTLYIGSSPTNYSMSGNKTVTDDYGKFKTYNKINFELPVETNNLTIYKADDNKYFTYINVAVPSSSYISTITHTISTKYMTETYVATYKTYTLNAYGYISNTYSGFINATSIPSSVELANVTYDIENGHESLPKSLLFIVNFSSYTNGKYVADSIEQIASSDSIIEGITNINTATTQMLNNNDETNDLQVDPFLLSVLEDNNEPTSEVIIEE